MASCAVCQKQEPLVYRYQRIPARFAAPCKHCGEFISGLMGWRAPSCWTCNTKRSKYQQAAAYQVGKAIRKGLLPRASECVCVDCGKPAEHYDHRDYRQPLNVQPVCRSCNCRRGSAVDMVELMRVDAA
jgi:hypothetical protein